MTKRERDVLGFAVRSATSAEIATTLFISENTASVHVSNILRELGAASRIQAAV